VRDFAQVKADGKINNEVTDRALSLMEIDEHGLDQVDRRILEVIIDKFKGGPVGLTTLAAASGEEISTIEDIYEPYLLQIGFLQRTPRGRTATEATYRHLGIEPPANQKNLL
jgi:Holliday junction DNA helicase RuvB